MIYYTPEAKISDHFSNSRNYIEFSINFIIHLFPPINVTYHRRVISFISIQLRKTCSFATCFHRYGTSNCRFLDVN